MYDDTITLSFRQTLKEKKVKKKGLSVRPVNFGNFKASLKNDGVFDLPMLLKLSEWSNAMLQQTAHRLQFIFAYHPDSPNYWLNDLKEKDDDGSYRVGIDLEQFMTSKKSKESSKRTGGHYVIADNYELAKKAMTEFRKIQANKKFKLEDVSFRDTAFWKSKDEKAIEAFADFLNKKYVQSTLKTILKQDKIKKCIFSGTEKRGYKLDFEYTK